MAVKLNRRAYDHARELVRERKTVLDDRDAWSEHRPSAAQENAYLEEHGYGEYGRWYLGVDDEMASDTKGHFKYPYGDFSAIHRCGVMSAEVRAAQQDHEDIEKAAAHLHGALDALM
jgi:hypothetical protein